MIITSCSELYFIRTYYIEHIILYKNIFIASAAVAYPLRALTCCVFRDALLHTIIM